LFLFKLRPAVLALLSAVLLWAGWPVHPAPLPLLLFVGWVPYLLMEYQLTKRGVRKRTVFGYTYLMLLLWNAFTTWWVSYSTLGGGIAAVVLNALLMCLPLMAFRQTKKRLGIRLGYASLPVYWIAFEQLHLHWDLTWPWLTLGNGFAAVPQWVQWYEYTGFLGGSIWIWGVNLALLRLLLVFELKVKSEELKSTAAQPFLSTLNLKLSTPVLAVALPIALSYLIGALYKEKGPSAEVVVVQPNIDPFEEKFSGTSRFIPYDEQLNQLLTRTEQHLTPQTRLVLWPETALEETYWENTIEAQPKIQRIRQWLARHPGVALLTGITSVTSYPNKEMASPTARFRDDLGYYDVFNAGAYFPSATAPIEFYHKSRLVPGVEKIPPLLTSVISHIDLGGTVGSYGSQAERIVYSAPPGRPEIRLAPIICYESVYGDFVAAYARNGATLLGIITNDGWWSDSPGYRQHLIYGALRAIETRRDIARSANTGISGFIDQKGNISHRTGWWVGAASRATVHLNDELTFYTRFGDLIGPTTQALSVLFLMAAFWISRPKPMKARLADREL